MKRLIGTLTAALLLTGVAACGSDGTADDNSASGEEMTLTVFAAASLKETFTEIGKQFEAENDGVTVTFNFAGSSDLVAQIQQGAPADVFASADTANMDKATADDLVEDEPVSFATNTLEVVTPTDNPAKVKGLDDLGKPGLKVVVCAAEVPCGAAAKEVEDTSGVNISPVSEEQSVTDVLNKVTSGEADAGLVYVTDAKAAGDKVLGAAIPEASNAVNTYPIAALSGSKNIEAAKTFATYVTGADGQAVLSAAGFARP